MDNSGQGDDRGVPLRPLTKRNKEDRLYERDARVERQIGDALSLSATDRIARAQINDEGAPGYLQAEAVAYLVQDAYATGQEWLFEQLWNALHGRCVRFVEGKLRPLDAAEAAAAAAEVMEELLLRILDLETGRGDYYQVRFWSGLEALAVSTFRRYWRVAKQADELIPLSDLAGEEAEQTGDDEAKHPSVYARPHRSAMLSPEQHLLVKDALVHVPEPYRSAFVLRYFANWPIEDQDSDVPTISQHFGKTPRTIRNWLSRAEQALEPWRGETP